MKIMFASLILAFCFISCTPNPSDNNTPPDDKNSGETTPPVTVTNQLVFETNAQVIQNLDGIQLGKINLPDGFKIEVFGRVPNARSMALSSSGILYVGNRSGDKVYALVDENNDMKADKRITLASDLRMPNGIAIKDGNLYVAEVSKLWKYNDIDNNLVSTATRELIYDDYPKDSHHGWKYIGFGPDGKLYVPVGAPCNICESKPDLPDSPNVHYASITRMNPDGSEREVYVEGVRNTVGFTWHPETGELWFTDNGRDWVGDEKPPCELNRVASMGQNFGYPYCHGGLYLDDEFGDGKNCDDYVKPAQNLKAHVAPLGVKFVTSSSFPPSYRNNILIAEHGSWNRSTKVGYQLSMVTETNGTGQSYETFVNGWLDDDTQESWGRPVDLIFAKDGSLLVSDDQSGTIYRIWYEE